MVVGYFGGNFDGHIGFMMTRELANVLYCFIYLLTVVEHMYVDNKKYNFIVIKWTLQLF